MGDWGGYFLGSAKRGAGGGGEQAPIQIQSPCLTATPGPGSLRCPVCLSTEDCESATELTCPAGSTHCYQGAIQLRGGEPGQEVPVGHGTWGAEAVGGGV